MYVHCVTILDCTVTHYLFCNSPALLNTQDRQCLIKEQLFHILFSSSHYAARGLVYCLLFKSSSEDKINNFLMGFSMVLITVILQVLHKH